MFSLFRLENITNSSTRNMKFKRVWFVLSIIGLSKLLHCLRSPIRIGNFKIVKKHLKTRSCAQKLLQQIKGGCPPTKEVLHSDESFNELTGDCKGFYSSFSYKNANDEDDVYVKAVSSKAIFSPPLKPSDKWMISDWVLGNSIMLNVKQVERSGYIDIHGMGADGFVKGKTILEFINSGKGEWEIIYLPSQTCEVFNVLVGEKTQITLKYRTNSSIEVTMGDSKPCMYNTDVHRGQISYMSGSFEVCSYTETYYEN